MERSLSKQKDSIIFTTGSFMTDKGSVLHSGIYNRELTSSMAAGALLVVIGLFCADRIVSNTLFWAALLVAFITLFIGFRYLIFKDPLITLHFNKNKGSLTITERRYVFSRTYKHRMEDLQGIKKGYTSSVPENPDGVKVVEGIALQHFTVIPGFGQPSEFHTVFLETKSGERIVVFASNDEVETTEVMKSLKDAIYGSP